MELIKDIYFNTDKLVENTKVKVSYTGKFYQENNNNVYIHYGYGKDWNNVNEVEMQKTDLGYQTELNLIGEDTLNFCFKNQNNEWDNNFGKNYIFNIEKNIVNNLGTTTIGNDKTSKKTSFFEKKFDTNNDTKTTDPYWNTNNNFAPNNTKQNPVVSGIVENANVNNSINSIDTVIDTNNTDSIKNNFTNINTVGINTQKNTITNSNTEYNIIKPSLDNNTSVNNVAKIISNEIVQNPVNLDNGITKKVMIAPIVNATTQNNVVNNKQIVNTTNALTIAPTGFQKTLIWTQKIKTTVCKFFAYVPKLISGNYKRNVNDNKK